MENYYSEHEGEAIDNVITNAGLHIQDTVSHVTQAERDYWNGKATAASVVDVRTQLEAFVSQGNSRLNSIHQELSSAIARKMDIGQLQNLADLQAWQVRQMLAYTIGFRTNLIGYKKMSSYASNMIFPMVERVGKFMIVNTSSTVGTYKQEDKFIYGAVTMNNVVTEGNLYGEFNVWNEIPRMVTVGGNMFYVILLCEEDFDNVKILMKIE